MRVAVLTVVLEIDVDFQVSLGYCVQMVEANPWQAMNVPGDESVYPSTDFLQPL